MRKITSICAIALILSSCSGAFNRAGPGLVYTDTVEGLYVDNNVSAARTGKACSTKILSLFVTGDASVEAAKRNGRISSVATMDAEYSNILGVYGKACTVVRGR